MRNLLKGPMYKSRVTSIVKKERQTWNRLLWAPSDLIVSPPFPLFASAPFSFANHLLFLLSHGRKQPSVAPNFISPQFKTADINWYLSKTRVSRWTNLIVPSVEFADILSTYLLLARTYSHGHTLTVREAGLRGLWQDSHRLCETYY